MKMSICLNGLSFRRYSRRRGFSLLEILLALAILGGSLAMLSRIVDTGTSAAREGRKRTQMRHALYTEPVHGQKLILRL